MYGDPTERCELQESERVPFLSVAAVGLEPAQSFVELMGLPSLLSPIKLTHYTTAASEIKAPLCGMG